MAEWSSCVCPSGLPSIVTVDSETAAHVVAFPCSFFCGCDLALGALLDFALALGVEGGVEVDVELEPF